MSFFIASFDACSEVRFNFAICDTLNFKFMFIIIVSYLSQALRFTKGSSYSRLLSLLLCLFCIWYSVNIKPVSLCSRWLLVCINCIFLSRTSCDTACVSSCTACDTCVLCSLCFR